VLTCFLITITSIDHQQKPSAQIKVLK